MASVSDMKRATGRADSEVEAILTPPRQPRGRPMTPLRAKYIRDIDRARMQLRVRDGKGAKGRVLPLSERLLKELVNYWRAQRQGKVGHYSP